MAREVILFAFRVIVECEDSLQPIYLLLSGCSMSPCFFPVGFHLLLQVGGVFLTLILFSLFSHFMSQLWIFVLWLL